MVATAGREDRSRKSRAGQNGCCLNHYGESDEEPDARDLVMNLRRTSSTADFVAWALTLRALHASETAYVVIKFHFELENATGYGERCGSCDSGEKSDGVRAGL